MRKLLATTALALLLSAPLALTLHAQDSGGSGGGGASSGSGSNGAGGGSAGGGSDTTGGASGTGAGDEAGSAGGAAAGSSSDTTGGASGTGAGNEAGSAGTSADPASSNETGGTTGALTTTPRAKSDDAAGTRGTAASEPANWGSTTGGDLVGQTVYGSDGEEIGDIQDIVSRNGGGPEALVGVGGFLGIGERDVAIPLSSLQMQGDRLTTNMTKESIGAMQPYDQSGYTSWDRSQAVGQ